MRNLVTDAARKEKSQYLKIRLHLAGLIHKVITRQEPEYLVSKLKLRPLCHGFLSHQKVKQLRIPTLFISGLADILVPPRMMLELHNRCVSIRKQILQIPTGTHNETWQIQGYYHSIAVFLQNCRLKNISELDIKLSEVDALKNMMYIFISLGIQLSATCCFDSLKVSPSDLHSATFYIM
nr:unnamed protein product [Callosobruchus analis]